MKQSNFTLGFIITLLSSLSFGFICFLGSTFLSLGNLSQSIIVGTSVSALLCVTALGAARLKRTKKNFKSRRVWEIILLILFTGLTIVFTWFIFPHYFVVNDQSEVIQNKLNESLRESKNLFSEYENYANSRQNDYKTVLESVVLRHQIGTESEDYIEYGFDLDGPSKDMQIQSKMTMMNLELFPSSYRKLKKDDLKWIEEYQIIVKNWEKKPLGIINVIKNIDKKTNTSRSQLVTISKSRSRNESTTDFYVSSEPKDVKKYFTTKGAPTLFSLFLSVFLYFMMLLSWFTSKREINGSRTASYEVVL
ncbi:hypothetical protein N9X07_04160 [Flavobacteriaceae bacterium]|nr:hypothetical protein [Flavobacteriaceae bacterium]